MTSDRPPRCLTCDAVIRVVATPRNGRVLLNPQPKDDGRVCIRADGLALRIVDDRALAAKNDRRIYVGDAKGLPRYEDHDNTCHAAAKVLAEAEKHGALSAAMKKRKP